VSFSINILPLSLENYFANNEIQNNLPVDFSLSNDDLILNKDCVVNDSTLELVVFSSLSLQSLLTLQSSCQLNIKTLQAINTRNKLTSYRFSVSTGDFIKSRQALADFTLAEKIEAAGGRYVDVAVMAPVYPKLHKTPLLLSGPHAEAGLAYLADLDMAPAIVQGDIGAGSSIKMIRSIMMKGMEALFAECVLAGRKAGVEEAVLASLDKTYPGFDFPAKAGYMLERSMTHGIRRAAEMEEVALTVHELGLANEMAKATVQWQRRIGNLKLDAGELEYQDRADMILKALQD